MKRASGGSVYIVPVHTDPARAVALACSQRLGLCMVKIAAAESAKASQLIEAWWLALNDTNGIDLAGPCQSSHRFLCNELGKFK